MEVFEVLLKVIVAGLKRAAPLLIAYGPVAYQFYQTYKSGKAGGASGHHGTPSDAANAPASADPQVGTKLHGTGGPIGYGKNGQYLKNALGARPSKH